MSKGKKIGLGLIILVIGLSMGIILFVHERTYTAMEEAVVSLDDYRVRQEDDWIVIQPEEEVKANLVLYPGGFVESEAYVPLALSLSEEGIRVILPHMPFHLAILDSDKFDSIYQAIDSDLPWWIGGHSLGGTSALLYASENEKVIEGAVLLASYPSENTDLSQSPLTVLSIDATHDTIINETQYEETQSLLPDDTSYVSIEGGNHSQFGYYGFQDGDGRSEITREEQHQQVVEAILTVLETSPQ
ncbi:alpha/beta hydrolase [Alkalibacterium iburiense]|uniref:Alpha/beta hydrolase n=1 Tax=Alkalibacterium iburiense TaxID=290589 RepID=A0ABN0WZY8_9LACT